MNRAALLPLLLLTGCFFSFPRGEGLGPGDVSGTALIDGAPAAFARVTLSGTHRVVSANADGVFIVRGLPSGAHALRVFRDENGDGWPEREATRAVQIRDEGFVLLGEVPLDPVVEVEGTVTRDGAPAAGAQVAAIPIFTLDGVRTEGAAQVVHSDASGRYRFPALAAIETELVALDLDDELASQRLRLEPSPGDAVTADPLLLVSADLDVAIQAFFAPPPEDGELGNIELTPSGAPPTLGAPDTPLGESVSLNARPGLYDIHVRTSTGRRVDEAGRVVAPNEEGLLVWAFVQLLEGPLCGATGRDCDDDGVEQFPRPGEPGSAAAAAACLDACLANLDVPCEVDGDPFDCDDDGDGQVDLTEPAACAQPFVGADRDADGVCDAADRFDNCAENDPAAPACAFDQLPPRVTTLGAGWDGAPPPVDGGPDPVDGGPPPDDGGPPPDDGGLPPDDGGLPLDDAGVDAGPPPVLGPEWFNISSVGGVQFDESVITRSGAIVVRGGHYDAIGGGLPALSFGHLDQPCELPADPNLFFTNFLASLDGDGRCTLIANQLNGGQRVSAAGDTILFFDGGSDFRGFLADGTDLGDLTPPGAGVIADVAALGDDKFVIAGGGAANYSGTGGTFTPTTGRHLAAFTLAGDFQWGLELGDIIDPVFLAAFETTSGPRVVVQTTVRATRTILPGQAGETTPAENRNLHLVVDDTGAPGAPIFSLTRSLFQPGSVDLSPSGDRLAIPYSFVVNATLLDADGTPVVLTDDAVNRDGALALYDPATGDLLGVHTFHSAGGGAVAAVFTAPSRVVISIEFNGGTGYLELPTAGGIEVLTRATNKNLALVELDVGDPAALTTRWARVLGTNGGSTFFFGPIHALDDGTVFASGFVSGDAVLDGLSARATGAADTSFLARLRPAEVFPPPAPPPCPPAGSDLRVRVITDVNAFLRATQTNNARRIDFGEHDAQAGPASFASDFYLGTHGVELVAAGGQFVSTDWGDPTTFGLGQSYAPGPSQAPFGNETLLSFPDGTCTELGVSAVALELLDAVEAGSVIELLDQAGGLIHSQPVLSEPGASTFVGLVLTDPYGLSEAAAYTVRIVNGDGWPEQQAVDPTHDGVAVDNLRLSVPR